MSAEEESSDRGAIERHRSHPVWGGYVNQLIQNGINQPRQGIDMGDHPPITTMASVDLNSLSGGEASLYELITKHFLSTVSDGRDIPGSQ